VRLPGTLGVVMTGHAAQEKYFRFRDDEVSQREAYQLMTPVFGKGIAYDAEPQIMKEQLGFFHSALRESRLRTYTEGFIAESEHYFGRWGERGEVNMLEVGNEVTLYTSTRCLLGEKMRFKLSKEFSELYADLEGGINVVSFFAPYLPLPAMRRRDRARVKMVELITAIVEERRRSPEGHEDILQTLVESSYADGRKLTLDEITGLILTIMFAGHHTSGVTFAWIAILLAQHPHVFRRLVAEQREILGERERITYDDLQKMKLLEGTIKEALRLYPPIILVMRRVLRAFDFQGYHVPEGAMVFACPAVGQRIPDIFAEPHRFDPDRYGPGREEDKRSPFGHIAFGAGRHRCMGVVFAQLQLRALWSHLLRNFEFDMLDPSYPLDFTNLIVGPRPPCRIGFRRTRRPEARPAA
jgi:sterol 14-demethylase